MSKGISPELEQYYQELFSMFSSKGWEHFLEVLNSRLESDVSSGWGLSTGEQLVFKSGSIHALREVTRFQEEHEHVYQELGEDDDSE